jgi:single-stranded-DNA-specific exonuclease
MPKPIEERYQILPPPSTGDVSALMAGLGVGALAACVLCVRGLGDIGAARLFLAPSFEEQWGRASEIDGIDEAADIIAKSVRARERILVFGDYDVDGIASTALLTMALERLGAKPDWMIPNRLIDGYGLTPGVLGEVCSRSCDLLVTVDCGIGSVSEVAELRRRGIKVVVTDHHEPPASLPVADALVDPKCDADSPDAILAGVGVALKLVEALGERLGQPLLWRDFIDLAMLGTIADVMPLRGRNRALVAEGMRLMREDARPGLAALMAASKTDAKDLDAVGLSFSLIPRINAGGRMGEASLGLELLRAQTIADAYRFAARLDDLNGERRRLERKLSSQALAQAAECAKDSLIYLLGGEKWHEGILGIVAARVAEKTRRPAIVYSVTDGVAKGSGRSVGSVNLFAALESCSDILTRFGGHAAAVGLTCGLGALEELRARLNAEMGRVPPESFSSPIVADAAVRLSMLSPAAVAELSRLEPFGSANPQPLFVLQGVFITGQRLIGEGRAHVAFNVNDGLDECQAVWFNCPDCEGCLDEAGLVDVLFNVRVDSWKGQDKAKIFVKAMFRSGIAAASMPAGRRFGEAASSPAGRRVGEAPAGSDREDALLDEVAEAALGQGAVLHAAQREALAALRAHERVLAVMATGRGKSLILQAHALRLAMAAGKASVIVYPLRSLINDQLFHIRSLSARFGIGAAALTGEVTGLERARVLEAFASGDVDIILTTPEFLEAHAAQLAQRRDVGFVAIDEAHHVAGSGARHRRAYADIARILSVFGDFDLLALTATANEGVAQALKDGLGVKRVVVDESMRPNLGVIDGRGIRDKDVRVAELAASGHKCIVYVGARDEALRVARMIRKARPDVAGRVAFYHAGVLARDRKIIEDALRTGELSCIVSTSAFGEGVNIPDISDVALYSLPYSMVEFNQLSGRAGRDGRDAGIHLLFGSADARQNRLVLAQGAPTRNDLACLWRALAKMGYDSIELNGEALGSLAAMARGIDKSMTLRNKGVAIALDILAELGLVELDGHEDGARLLMRRPAGKADLEASPLFREGECERMAFESFASWVLKADAQTLLDTVNRPMTPAGTDAP